MTPFTESDITEEYLAALNNKEFMKYSEQRFKDHTKESAIKYLETFSVSPNYFWSFDNHGTMTTYFDGTVADMGIMFWDKGFALSAWNEAIKFLFSVGVTQITASTEHANAPMIVLMIKSGMTVDFSGKLVSACLLR